MFSREYKNNELKNIYIRKKKYHAFYQKMPKITQQPEILKKK